MMVLFACTLFSLLCFEFIYIHFALKMICANPITAFQWDQTKLFVLKSCDYPVYNVVFGLGQIKSLNCNHGQV